MLKTKKINVDKNNHFSALKDTMILSKKMIMKEIRGASSNTVALFNGLFENSPNGLFGKAAYLNIDITDLDIKRFTFYIFPQNTRNPLIPFFEKLENSEFFEDIQIIEDPSMNAFPDYKIYTVSGLNLTFINELVIVYLGKPTTEEEILRMFPITQYRVLYSFVENKVYMHKDVLDCSKLSYETNITGELQNSNKLKLIQSICKFTVNVNYQFKNNIDRDRYQVFLTL